MNKFAWYVILLGTYLTLAKSLAPDNMSYQYIKKFRDLDGIVDFNPASVILIGGFTRGFFFKTYHLKYKVVYGFHPVRLVTIRTNRGHFEGSLKYLNHSVFRIDNDGNQNDVPLPPGSVFIENRRFGKWSYSKGRYTWKFYRAFKKMPQHLGWDKFVPDRKMYKEIIEHRDTGRAFLNHEFFTGVDKKKLEALISNETQFLKSQLDFSGLKKIYFAKNYSEN